MNILNKQYYEELSGSLRRNRHSFDPEIKRTIEVFEAANNFEIPDYELFYPKKILLDEPNEIYFFCEDFLYKVDLKSDELFRKTLIKYSSIKSLELLKKGGDQFYKAISIKIDDTELVFDPDKDSAQYHKRVFLESIDGIYEHLYSKYKEH
ncbi:hypothetical protein [Virgibacillus sediminis]|uniref:DUF3908 domain-containing protein n=1 Tax=Virgibacillus sediminis TaxID=202260 RepID=A0ABV7A6Q9_9BACI